MLSSVPNVIRIAWTSIVRPRLARVGMLFVLSRLVWLFISRVQIDGYSRTLIDDGGGHDYDRLGKRRRDGYDDDYDRR